MRSRSSRLRSTIALVVSLTVALSGVATPVVAHDEPNGRPHHINAPMNPTATMRAFMEGKLGEPVQVQALAATSNASCDTGFADIYPCEAVDLLAFLPLAEIG